MTAKRRKFGDVVLLRGRYEVGVDGHRITLPYDFRSAIHELCDGQEALLRFCPIENAAYKVTLHTTLPEEIEFPGVIRRIDARGRISLPRSLVNLLRGECTRTVALVGLLDAFEIWRPERFDEVERQFEEDFPAELAAFNALIAELNNETK